MASKDQRPKTRLGKSHPGRVKAITWTIVLLLFCGRRLRGVPVHRHHRSGSAGGARAPRRLHRQRADARRHQELPLHDSQGARRCPACASRAWRPMAGRWQRATWWWSSTASSQEQMVIMRSTNVQSVDGDIVQMKATQKMNDEQDAMSKMTVRVRAGARQARRQQGGSPLGDRRREEPDPGGRHRGRAAAGEGVINAHQVGNEADLGRLGQRKDKAIRDLATAQKYLEPDAASGADRRRGERAAELPRAGHLRRSRSRRSRKATTPGRAPRSWRSRT